MASRVTKHKTSEFDHNMCQLHMHIFLGAGASLSKRARNCTQGGWYAGGRGQAVWTQTCDRLQCSSTSMKSVSLGCCLFCNDSPPNVHKSKHTELFESCAAKPSANAHELGRFPPLQWNEYVVVYEHIASVGWTASITGGWFDRDDSRLQRVLRGEAPGHKQPKATKLTKYHATSCNGYRQLWEPSTQGMYHAETGGASQVQKITMSALHVVELKPMIDLKSIYCGVYQSGIQNSVNCHVKDLL